MVVVTLRPGLFPQKPGCGGTQELLRKVSEGFFLEFLSPLPDVVSNPRLQQQCYILLNCFLHRVSSLGEGVAGEGVEEDLGSKAEKVALAVNLKHKLLDRAKTCTARTCSAGIISEAVPSSSLLRKWSGC